jgi:hypothetical protein
MSERPHWGFTRHHGFAVHAQTIDHLKPAAGDSRYQRFNKRIALWMTQNTGTMTCFWIIELACLLALPSVLFSMGLIHLKLLLTSYGFYLLLTWGISTNFQAIMLPALAVGQAIGRQADDARAAKQFEDTEQIADRLDCTTEGGITEVLTAITSLKSLITSGAAGERVTRYPDWPPRGKDSP